MDGAAREVLGELCRVNRAARIVLPRWLLVSEVRPKGSALVKDEKPMNSSKVHVESAALKTRGRVPWILLLVGLVLPSAITWVYFIALAQQASGFQQIAYGIGKGSQFLLPMVAVWWWGEWKKGMLPVIPWGTDRQKSGDEGGDPKPVENIGKEWLLAISLGCVVALAMVVLYAVLLPSGGMDQAKREGMLKLESLGIGSPVALLMLAAFYAILHSGFEEFYWRGFLFQGLRQYCSVPVAVVVSSLGFMAHHVLVLGKFFGYDSLKTYFFSISIAVGGGAWAWIVSRTDSLVPSWISHGIIDAAIFLIALHLIFFSG